MSHDKDIFTFTKEELDEALEESMMHCEKCGAWVPASEDGRCGYTRHPTAPWHPIVTAPLHTDILVCDAEAYAPETVRLTGDAQRPLYHHTTRNYGTRVWATHWMPLPEPPPEAEKPAKQPGRTHEPPDYDL